MSHKVVYNACYGGFSLSMKAVDWLEYNSKDETLLEHIKNCRKDRLYSISAFRDQMLCYSVSEYFDCKRHHKDLVTVVEALGNKASGTCAELEIMEISGNQYRIDEYDGFEEVITPEGSDWIIIND